MKNSIPSSAIIGSPLPISPYILEASVQQRILDFSNPPQTPVVGEGIPHLCSVRESEMNLNIALSSPRVIADLIPNISKALSRTLNDDLGLIFHLVHSVGASMDIENKNTMTIEIIAGRTKVLQQFLTFLEHPITEVGGRPHVWFTVA